MSYNYNLLCFSLSSSRRTFANFYLAHGSVKIRSTFTDWLSWWGGCGCGRVKSLQHNPPDAGRNGRRNGALHVLRMLEKRSRDHFHKKLFFIKGIIWKIFFGDFLRLSILFFFVNYFCLQNELSLNLVNRKDKSYDCHIAIRLDKLLCQRLSKRGS